MTTQSVNLMGNSYARLAGGMMGANASGPKPADEAVTFDRGDRFEGQSGRDVCRKAINSATATFFGTALAGAAVGAKLGLAFGAVGGVIGGVAGLVTGAVVGDPLAKKVYEKIAGPWADVCFVNFAEESRT